MAVAVLIGIAVPTMKATVCSYDKKVFVGLPTEILELTVAEVASMASASIPAVVSMG